MQLGMKMGEEQVQLRADHLVASSENLLVGCWVEWLVVMMAASMDSQKAEM